MPAEKKIHKKLQQQHYETPIAKEHRIWIEIIIYSLMIYVLIGGHYLVTNASFTSRLFNRSIADLALILIGLSLMLSSVCYFWDFADSFIKYRKHLGLVGFGYMVLHILMSVLMSQYAPFTKYYLSDYRIFSFSAAAVATVIFTIMALISNRFSIIEIGPKRWRNLMRVGIIGFALTLYHFSVNSFKYWMPWLTGKSEDVFPAFGMIVFFFGVVVVGLRIALFIATSFYSSKKK